MTSKYKPRNAWGDEVETREQNKTTIKDSLMYLFLIWEMLFANNKQKSKSKEPNGIQDIAVMIVVILALIIFS